MIVRGSNLNKIHAQHPAFFGKPVYQLAGLHPVEPARCLTHHCRHDGWIKTIGINGQIVGPTIGNSIQHRSHADVMHLIGGNDVGPVIAGIFYFLFSGTAVRANADLDNVSEPVHF